MISSLILLTSESEVQRSGISPIHLSAESSEDEALELLIHAGFNVNFLLAPERSCMYEDHRRSALYFAVDNRNLAAASMLLEAGADPNLDLFNVLLLAVRQGDMRMATLLLEHGADVNASLPTHPSTFPACIMLSVRNITMMKCLMDHGCDAEACFRCEHGAEEHGAEEHVAEEGPSLQVLVTFKTFQQIKCSSSLLVLLLYLLYLHTQFCEMISARSVRHCTGPVINLLLDYVSSVKLCSRLQNLLDSEDSWTHIRDKSGTFCTCRRSSSSE